MFGLLTAEPSCQNSSQHGSGPLELEQSDIKTIVSQAIASQAIMGQAIAGQTIIG